MISIKFENEDKILKLESSNFINFKIDRSNNFIAYLSDNSIVPNSLGQVLKNNILIIPTDANETISINNKESNE